jgi:pseudaminic acid synthase
MSQRLVWENTDMPQSPTLRIAGRLIGEAAPAYLIAELSANHHQSLEEAKTLIRLAREHGADAVKLQTYTPDSITLDCDNDYFRIGPGSPWAGRSLHELYAEAHTPLDWHAELFAEARRVGIPLFSSPFDETAVDLLESLDSPAYKIASFELVHHPLLRRVARTGRPVLLSTGMATLEEIAEAVEVLRAGGCRELALLKCTSAYPAPVEEANLRRIPDMARRFEVVAGLSDHTLEPSVAVAAVVIGARIVEKHFTRSRAVTGPDSAFSLEPAEWREMCRQIRTAEQALGSVTYDLTEKERSSLPFRRSIFAARDIAAGERFSSANLRIVRPGNGLAPREFERVLGRQARVAVPRGTPLAWVHVEGQPALGSHLHC